MKRFQQWQWCTFWLLVLCLVVGACGTDSPVHEADTGLAGMTSPPAPKAGKAQDQAALRASVAKAMQRDASEVYAAAADMPGRFLLTNPAHRMTATADRAGLVVRAKELAASLSLRTIAYGCEGATREVVEREPAAERNRLSFARSEHAMEEWYLNGPLGVEQGFSLTAAPACTGTKVITMEALGDVSPMLEDADGDGRGDLVRFVAENGLPGFVYRDLGVVDAAGKKLAAWMTVDAGQITLHWDDAGAAYPVVVDPVVVTQQGKLLPDDGGGNERMGQSVAISSDGTRAIVGANDDATGVAFIYERESGQWILKQRLRASDATDHFGDAVAIDGDTAIVAAPYMYAQTGAVYVFVRSNGQWPSAEAAKLTKSNGAPYDYFGHSVAISGDTVVVGTYWDDAKGADSGAAYVFVKPMGGWATTGTANAQLVASDGAASDQFGDSVAISGNSVIVGANNKKAAYIFSGSGSSWTQQKKLAAQSGANYFASSVAISGVTAVVGAAYADSGYVFENAGGVWPTTATATLKTTNGSGTAFGTSVAIDATTVIVGAPGDDENGIDSGAAYVFVRPTNGWVTTSQPTAKLKDNNKNPGDALGSTVVIRKGSVMLGAPSYDNPAIGVNSGKVLPFTGANSNWLQESALTWSKGASGDQAGYSVAIAEDGLTAVVGAPYDDDQGVNSGSAYIFVKPAGAGGWSTLQTYTAKLTANGGAFNDFFGTSVAISGDTVIVGAPRHVKDLISNAGAVYVFVKPSSGWGTTKIYDAKLTASANDIVLHGYFGQSVAISGDTAIVGADRSANQNLGAAYIFVRNGTMWPTTPTAKLTADDGFVGNEFGASVALSGDTAIVGAFKDNDKGTWSGSAYVFVKPTGGSWPTTQTAKLTATDGAASDQFGRSVGISGNTVVVGAYYATGIALRSGAAYVFDRIGSTWPTSETEKLEASNGASFDYFGASVAISGDTVIIGAPYDDDKGPDAGSVYVFRRTAGVWDTGTSYFAPDGTADDAFGSSVAMAGATVVVGAPRDDDPSKGVNSGAASVMFVQRSLGASCNDNAHCDSAFCADGVCCEEACSGFCVACSANKKGSGVDGTCGPIASGAPPRQASYCSNAQNETCGNTGMCDGSGQCQKATAGTTCGAGVSCLGNKALGFSCTGSGYCVLNPDGVDCTPYKCGDTGCGTTCTSDADCTDSGYCDDMGHCQKDRDIAATCTQSKECASGYCVDGVCCDSPCDGPCQACSAGYCGNAAQGTPDDACAPDPNNPCGYTGTCTEFGECKRQKYGEPCDGSYCDGFLRIDAKICNGTGQCVPDLSTQEQCFPYLCESVEADGGTKAQCKKSCVQDNSDAGTDDCVKGFVCRDTQCVPDTPECERSSDCGPGQVCDPEVPHRCIPNPGPPATDTGCDCQLPARSSERNAWPIVSFAILVFARRRMQRRYAA